MYIRSLATVLQKHPCGWYGICIFRVENKKGETVMKRMIIALMLVLAAGMSASAAMPQSRQDRKAMQAAEDSVRFAATVETMKNMDFVLEADRLVLSRGQNVLVNSMTNFVSVNDLQYRVSKKGNVTLSMYVSGAVASCKVTFSLPKGGTTATVRIDPNYSSNDISLVGRIVPTALSHVYEGLSL